MGLLLLALVSWLSIAAGLLLLARSIDRMVDR